MIKSYNKKKLICGIDEAGRGALAGPVTISAVILPKSYHNEKIKDSKRLVNWVRLIKSDAEINLMKGAAKISENAMKVAMNSIV